MRSIEVKRSPKIDNFIDISVLLKYRLSEIVLDFVNKVVLTTGDKIIYIYIYFEKSLYIYIYIGNYLVIRGQKVIQNREIGNCQVPILEKRHQIHSMHTLSENCSLILSFCRYFINLCQYWSVISFYNMPSHNTEQEKYKH